MEAVNASGDGVPLAHQGRGPRRAAAGHRHLADHRRRHRHHLADLGRTSPDRVPHGRRSLIQPSASAAWSITVMCPSPGRSQSSAPGILADSHRPWEAGTIRSASPCSTSTEPGMSAGSKSHGATAARSSSIAAAGPAAIAGRTTSRNHDHRPPSASSSSGVKPMSAPPPAPRTPRARPSPAPPPGSWRRRRPPCRRRSPGPRRRTAPGRTSPPWPSPGRRAAPRRRARAASRPSGPSRRTGRSRARRPRLRCRQPRSRRCVRAAASSRRTPAGPRRTTGARAARRRRTVAPAGRRCWASRGASRRRGRRQAHRCRRRAGSARRAALRRARASGQAHHQLAVAVDLRLDDVARGTPRRRGTRRSPATSP